MRFVRQHAQVLLALSYVGALCWVIDFALNRDPSAVGHDYGLWLPRLIEGRFFFKSQGFSIPWYSPAFCGGAPFFPDPQSMYYSIPQLLTFLFAPWVAVRLSVALMVFVGACGGYLLARSPFGLSRPFSLIAGASYASCHFFVGRAMVGHVPYQSFQLIPLMAFALLSSRLRNLAAILVCAICGAYVVHSGGYFIPIVGALNIGLLAAIAFVLSPMASSVAGVSFKYFVVRTIFSAGLALSLCASKLVAGYYFLRVIPHDVAPQHIDGMLGLLIVLVKQLFLIHSDAQPFLPENHWEVSLCLNPLLAFGLLRLLYFLIVDFRYWNRIRQSVSWGWIISVVVFIALIMITLGLLAGNSTLAYLLQLVGLSGYRVNTRFTAGLIAPVVVLGCVALERVGKSFGWRAPLAITVCWTLSSIYFLGLHSKDYDYSFPKSVVVALGGDVGYLNSGPSKVTLLGLSGDSWVWQDAEAYLKQTTIFNCYARLWEKWPFKQELQDGPIDLPGQPTFNLMNPACLVFPMENRCAPGSLIQKSDEGNMIALLKRRNVSWSRPFAQDLANAITKITLLIMLAFAVNEGVRGVMK